MQICIYKGFGISQQSKMPGVFTERVPVSYACYGKPLFARLIAYLMRNIMA